MNLYDFTVKDNKGNDVSLKDYEGKVLLIVNTATKCGLTPQYEMLEQLYEKYKDRGLEVLDFPCNQFMHQAPGTDEEINSFCTLNYNTTFPRFQKIDVNGKNAAPLYVWLKEEIPEDKGDEQSKKFEKKVKLLARNKEDSDIKWNFGKFLIDREGNAVQRYSPAYTGEMISEDIEAII
ncbi:MAG: glutathione peroxidase [Christensenella sp.]|uniref:glutathione peroxidase n=1 Tax=Christensenella sp. TaxID=1935934 RepID=UPI002B2156A8|nr:glutathione peroxidase [Christensenella sp.]MEA5003242.1 glutathione peroxidase [Christensenella sp.]